MKLKMAKNSLFAILLRSPWWISIAIAAGLVLLAGASLHRDYFLYGAMAAAPFFIVGLIAAWRQLRAPSKAQVEATLQKIVTMSWPDFSGAVEQGFRRDGYEVTRLGVPAADFAIERAGRTTLISCKRWKAASNGPGPLRELHAAMEAREAHYAFYLTVGDVTDNARQFAAKHGIRLVQGAELAHLLRDVKA